MIMRLTVQRAPKTCFFMCAGSEEKSCKTAFAMELLQELHGQGERSLVFSQSRARAKLHVGAMRRTLIAMQA